MNSQLVLILSGLMLAKLVSAAVDVSTGSSVLTVGPVEMFVLTQLLMAIAGGMPHPNMLKTMGLPEFVYTWLYNSANIIAQNIEKRYHPQPNETVVEVSKSTVTKVSTATDGAAAAAH